MQIRYKKLHPDARPPYRASNGAAGFDLTATTRTYDAEHAAWIYGTGLSLEIPAGYVGLLFPRSSVYRTPLILANCVGVIDADFRGEVKAIFRDVHPVLRTGTGSQTTADEDAPTAEHYEVGERIAQLILLPLPDIAFVESEELSQTERGEHGYGSTGRRTCVSGCASPSPALLR